MFHRKEKAMSELLTKAEVCRLLRVTLPTLTVWHKEGRLPFIRIGKNAVRIAAADVRKFIQSSRDER
jgi:excisionase family DNA binding protein